LRNSVFLGIGAYFGHKLEEEILEGFGGVSLEGKCALLQ